MELGVFWRSLRQRWYLVLALLVLTAGATFLVSQRVGPTYEATGTVLVFPPSQAEGPTGEMSKENPYLTLSGVNQARDVVVRALTSKQVSDEFGKEYPPGTSYEIVPDYTNSAPIILFTVEAATPDDAAAALQFLVGRVPLELDKLQAGLDLPTEQQVTSLTLTQDEQPATTRKAMIRASLMTAAALGGLGLLVIALVDGLLTARRRDPDPEAGAAEDEAEVDEDEDEAEADEDEDDEADDDDRDDAVVAEGEGDEGDEEPAPPPREPLRLERRREARESAGRPTSGSTVTTRLVRRRGAEGERGEAS